MLKEICLRLFYIIALVHEVQLTKCPNSISVVASFDENTPILTETLCEDWFAELACNQGESLRIVRAHYGRFSLSVCNKLGVTEGWQVDCTSPKAMDYYFTKCNGRRSCNFQVLNPYNIDPCPKTYKYAEIKYKCVKDKARNCIIEPGPTEYLRVNCSMNVMTSTDWDTISALTVYHSSDNKNYTVVAHINKDSQRVNLRRIYDGEGHGAISNTSESYLSVEWANPGNDRPGFYRCEVEGTLKSGRYRKCSVDEEISLCQIKKEDCLASLLIDAKPPNDVHIHTITACENKSLDLSCNDHEIIHIVKAHYGRTSMSVCNPLGVIGGWQARCFYPRAMDILSARCNERTYCNVQVGQPVFPDPCPGTNKYAEVQFKCISGNSTHSVIYPGSTETLFVRCASNYKTLTEWDTVSSITLYHSRNKMDYEVLGYVNKTYQWYNATRKYNFLGGHLDIKTSYPPSPFLSFEWTYPYYDKAGIFRCEVEGTLESKGSQNCSVYEEVSTSQIKNENCSTWIFIDAQPHKETSRTKYIEPGITKMLLINCTMDITRKHELETLNSLTLLHYNDKISTFIKIAEISKNKPVPTANQNTIGEKAVFLFGTFSDTSESYLGLQWSYPGFELAGDYECSSQGTLKSGEIRNCSVHADIYAVKSCAEELKIITNLNEGNHESNLATLDIKKGITKYLEVNCSLIVMKTIELDMLYTLTLLRSGEKGAVYKRVASINIDSSEPDIADAEDATGHGLISKMGESYLSIKWLRPDNEEAGTYTCEASGTTMAGKLQKCSVSDNIFFIQSCATAFEISTMLYDDDQMFDDKVKPVRPGITKYLKVICSFNVARTIEFDRLEYLTLLRSEVNSSVYKTVASFNTFTKRFEIVNDKHGTGNSFSSKSESYLYVQWEYPDYDKAGTYRCEASGMSTEGKLETCSDSANVTSIPVEEKNESCSTSLYIDALPLKAKAQRPSTTHTHIETGSTEKLLIKCSLNIQNIPAIYILESLILLRADVNKPDYHEVASINPDDGVIVKDGDGVGSGLISSKVESYLLVEWAYPDHELAGTYRCEAHASTKLRKRKNCSASAVISSSEISLKSIHQQLKLVLHQNIQILEGSKKLKEIENLVRGSTAHIMDLKKTISKMTPAASATTCTKSLIEEMTETFVFQSQPYSGKRYYLSKMVDVVSHERDQATCMKFGGYLAEIDGPQELNFVRTLLINYRSTGLHILVSGNDEWSEGVYVYERYDKGEKYLTGVNFKSFATGQPDGGMDENCLYLAYDKALGNWHFYDFRCALYSKFSTNSFLCEIAESVHLESVHKESVGQTKTETAVTVKDLRKKLAEEMTLLFQSKPYKGHQYYLSKATDFVFNEKVLNTCAKYGGYLAEIDDVVELNIVRTVLQNYTSIGLRILIAGKDEFKDGTYLYTRMTKERHLLPDEAYHDFATGQPNGGLAEKCLYLSYLKSHNNWFNYDFKCALYSKDLKNSFLCEFEDL